MYKFNSIDTIYSLNDFIYSELTCLAYIDIDFFDFLNNEKNRYITNDLAFNTLLSFELEKHSLNKNIYVNIDAHWDYLKTIINVAKELKNIQNTSNVIFKDNIIYLDNLIFKSKTVYDMNLEIQSLLLNNNFNYYDYIDLMLIHIKQYLKPDYLLMLNDFITILSELNIKLNYDNFINYKLDSVGLKNLNLPKIYYRNLSELCSDLLNTKDCFRDYSLMLDLLNKIKYDYIYIKQYVPYIKSLNIDMRDLFFKYYGIMSNSYYYYDNEIKFVSSKESFIEKLNDLKCSYFKNNKNDLIVKISNNNILLDVNITYNNNFEIQTKTLIK